MSNFYIFCILVQLWKLDGTTLLNKAGIWKSTSEWNFVPNDDGRVYIEIASDDNNVLGIKGDEVIPEVKDPVKTGQLWIKGEERAGCYFTLKNNESSKVLTAIPGNSLKVKGNSKKKDLFLLVVSLPCCSFYTQMSVFHC